MSRPLELSSAAESGREPIHVLVGILTDARGRILIAQRTGDRHMAGAWEFPGGKRRDGESRLSALARELAEELDVQVVRAAPFLELVHEYPDRSVRLDVWRVREYRGVARSREGQALKWVPPAELGAQPILEADAPIIEALLAAGDDPSAQGE